MIGLGLSIFQTAVRRLLGSVSAPGASIVGVVNVDTTLSLSVSGGTPTSYQWQSLTGAAYANISGATSATYPPAAADGVNIRCVVGFASGSVTTAPAAYLGQVATRAYVPNNMSTGGGIPAGGKSIHYTRQPITELQVAYGNWEVNTGGGGTERAMSNSLTLAVNIEYPVGTVVGTFLWSGAGSTVFPSGGTALTKVSDVLSGLNIPAGALFALDPSPTIGSEVATSGSTAGMPYTRTPNGTVEDTANGETFTLNGVVQINACYYPLAIIAPTTGVTIGAVGDSRCAGQYGTVASNGDTGEVAPSIGPSFAYINMGVPSDQGNYFGANGGNNSVQRRTLWKYVSHLVYQLGINDLRTGARTIAQMATIDANFLALAQTAGKPAYSTTIAPSASSTDNFTTIANETAESSGPNRIAVNQARRAAGYQGFAGNFDTATQVENGQDGGVWKANGTANYYTADGLHESEAGYLLIRDSGVIATSAFVR